MRFLRGFLEREQQLARIRRALLEGRPEEALERLRDPRLSLSRRATELREVCLEALCRGALERHRAGRDASQARVLALLRSEDLDRAEVCEARLEGLSRAVSLEGGEGDAREEPATEPPTETEPQTEPRTEPAAGEPSSPEPGGGDSATWAAPPEEASPQRTGGEGPEPSSFLLSVDDGGEYLVCFADELVLGHLQSSRADLPFLADVAPEHAVLRRRASLRGGSTLSIAPMGSEVVRVDGRAIDGACDLAPGNEVELAVNLAFRLREPDPASSSVVLDLLRGSECAGTANILLLDSGAGGAIRIGPGSSRHVRVSHLEHEVDLSLEEGRLRVRCAAAVRGPGEPLEAPGTEPPGASSEASRGQGLSLPCPPPARLDLSIGEARDGRPPFGLSVLPADLPRARRRS